MLKLFFRSIVCLCMLAATLTSIAYAVPVPHDYGCITTVKSLKFLEENKEIAFDNGVVLKFTRPVGSIRKGFDAESDYFYTCYLGYYSVIGVEVEIKNTSDSVAVIKWNQSVFRLGDSKGIPFIEGMKYRDAGNPSATPDTILPPHDSSKLLIFSSRVKYNKGWEDDHVLLSPECKTDAGMYMKIECNGTSEYYGGTSPSIGF